jgi:isopenicillin N synthase-like dioxygenase
VEIPSINLAILEGAACGGELERLHRAARDIGAFRTLGHGVDAGVAEELLAASRRLFALPQADRDEMDMIHSAYFRGFSALGTERTQGQPDLREQFDVGPEEAPIRLTTGDPPYLRLHGPNLWPAALPELRPAVLRWMELLRSVSQRLMAAIAGSIGLSGETFAAGYSGRPHERLKIIKYPPVPPESTQQGVGEHSDSGFLALIAQDGTQGLQVHNGRAFIDVTAPRGSLIAVLGRAFADATAGKVLAARHRVVSPPAGRERVSVAYFLNPRLDHAGYGHEALKVVLRSHPHVARRFFADLPASDAAVN